MTGRGMVPFALALALVLAAQGAMAADQGAAVPSEPLADPSATSAGAADTPATGEPPQPNQQPAEFPTEGRPSAPPQPLMPAAAEPAPPEIPKGAAPTIPAAKAPPPKLCDTVACRPSGKISLVLTSGASAEIDQPGYAYVTPTGIVTVLPGEKVAVEFAEAGGKLTSPGYAPEIRAAERTLVLELAKSEGGPMLLTVRNPFSHPLKYDASIEVVGRDGKPLKLKRTSTCAVAAGGAAFEMWPEAIARVQAENFRLLQGGEATCK